MLKESDSRSIMYRIVTYISDFRKATYSATENPKKASSIIFVRDLFKSKSGKADTKAFEMFANSFLIWKGMKNELDLQCKIAVLQHGQNRKIEVVKDSFIG